jgi:integrase
MLQRLDVRCDNVGGPVPDSEVVGRRISAGSLSHVARDAINEFARQESWRPKRRADYENAVATFTQAMGGDPDLGAITRELATKYMRDLAYYPSNANKRMPYRDLSGFAERVEAVKATNDPDVLNGVTINGKYLTPLRRIFEWRRVDLPELENPFGNLTAPKPNKKDRARRRDFSNAEVIRLFSQPIFAGAAAHSHKGLYKTGSILIDDWRFWVPLICLFTGMRLNEACGLAVADVRQADGVTYFHVRDEVEGQSLKSIKARRKVPVHDQLVGVGFLRFVERQHAAGRIRLFEDLQEDESGYFSGIPSKFFGKLIDRIEDDEPDDPGDLVFHSTRHTVTTRLRAAEVRSDVSKEIVGHEQDEVHAGYGMYPLPMLKQAVNKIAYEGLNLSSLVRL